MRFSLKDVGADVRPVVTQQTYGLEPGRTAKVWQGNLVFTNRPIGLVSLL
jgi:hypothetical protein